MLPASLCVSGFAWHLLTLSQPFYCPLPTLPAAGTGLRMGSKPWEDVTDTRMEEMLECWRWRSGVGWRLGACGPSVASEKGAGMLSAE